MKAYSCFASNYDDLTNDIDYSLWVEYIHNIIIKKGITPGLVADLGCGTGSFCAGMASKGYDMIGIDISPEMLSIAANKRNDNDILFLNQDMTEFELYTPVKVITSLLDSINHIIEPKQLLNMFKLVYKYLESGGLFIFDVNTMYKFSKIYADNVYYSVEDKISYIWQNNFNRKTNICDFELTFFKREVGGKYIRFDENFSEKAYTNEEIESLLKKSKLKLLNCYDNLSGNPPIQKSERVFYIAQK